MGKKAAQDADTVMKNSNMTLRSHRSSTPAPDIVKPRKFNQRETYLSINKSLILDGLR